MQVECPVRIRFIHGKRVLTLERVCPKTGGDGRCQKHGFWGRFVSGEVAIIGVSAYLGRYLCMICIYRALAPLASFLHQHPSRHSWLSNREAPKSIQPLQPYQISRHGVPG